MSTTVEIMRPETGDRVADTAAFLQEVLERVEQLALQRFTIDDGAPVGYFMRGGECNELWLFTPQSHFTSMLTDHLPWYSESLGELLASAMTLRTFRRATANVFPGGPNG